MSAGSLLNASIGAYRLVDFLGAGGMGEVYRAVHVSLGRVVALKVLTSVGTDPVSLERFRNEARVHAKLQHPSIATLFDFIDLGGQPCIVMEYVDGDTLDEHIRRAGGLAWRDALRVFDAIADAVAYLHRSGIIHRDIKSNNVKISSAGAVKLLDFGIAKASFSPTLTAIGGVIGTTHYLAPEQLTRGGADTRSDVWSLGVLLYEMLTGRLPFEGEGLGSLTEHIVRAVYTPASRVNPGVPREVDTIVARCLRRRPEERYPSAVALLADVRALRTAPVRTEEAAAPASPERSGAAAPWRQRWSATERWAAAWLSSFSGWVDAAAVWSRPHWRVTAAGAAALAALVFLFWTITRPAPGPAAPPPSASPPDSAVEPASAVVEPIAPLLETIHITVRGGPALVYREGRFINGTPFDLQEAVGERVRLTLERAGYQPLHVEFVVGEGKTAYEFELTPLPSTPVPQDPPDSASLGLLLLPLGGWLRRRRGDRPGGPRATSRVASSPPTDPGTGVDLAPRVEAAVLSDLGCVRDVNEDAICVIVPRTPEEQERRGHLAVVADGMGGHMAGEIASRLAIERVVESYAADAGDPAQALVRALRQANAAIREATRADPTLAGMGTTCTALAIRRGLAYCAHVGDSRLYLARDGQLLQMTEDHSAVMDLVRRGVLTRDEARHHPDRNVILRALGSREELEVSIWPRPFAVRPGDRFILCSDGLYDLVEEPELLARVTEGAPGAACRQLVALARERGAPDNVSVGVLALCAGDATGPASGPSVLKETRTGEETGP